MTDSAVLVIEQPTPMGRLQVVTGDPNTMEVVGQRVMDGWTLKQVARAWNVPVIAFVAWIVGDPERKAMYESALKVRADELALETIDIADGDGSFVNPKHGALRVGTRMKLATFLDRERFGERKATTPTARVVVDRRVDGVQDTVAVEVGGD